MNIYNLNKIQNIRPKVFTWHVHGTYLYYLTQCNCDFYIPFKKDRPAGYGGKIGSFPWGDNLHEVPYDEVKNLDFDCILYQQSKHYLEDQYKLLSDEQRDLPKIYLEHDPPRQTPTDTKHVVSDPSVLIVHVTNFNNLMWDNNKVPSAVIEHGVIIPKSVFYKGDKAKGIVVVNNLQTRGRRLGLDVFEYVREFVPLDLIGMGSEELGGLGEVTYDKLPEFISHYRFFFNPIRYTSLGLSVIEAMMVGLPIVGLSTTEMTTAIQNNVSGLVDTNIDNLISFMKMLIDNPEKAKGLGQEAKAYAYNRFNIERFKIEWKDFFDQAYQQKNAKDRLNRTQANMWMEGSVRL